MLTPDDLVNYPLKLSVRGYSVAQVDDLLDRAADTIDQLQRQVADLGAQLAISEERLAATSDTEDTLKRTLVTAQRAAEQSIEEARERAASMVEEAEREAQDQLERARAEAGELRASVERSTREDLAAAERRQRQLEERIASLRAFEEEYRAQLRTALEARLDQLDAVGESAIPEPRLFGEPPSPGGSPPAPPSDVADLLEPTPPAGANGRRPLTVRVHEEEAVRHEPAAGGREDDGPTDGEYAGDGPLASEAAPHGASEGSDPEDPGQPSSDHWAHD